MEDGVRAALTREEWAQQLAPPDGVYWSDQIAALGRAEDAVGVGLLASDGALLVTYDSAVCAVCVPQTERHALAALALHGQLFGPTWTMVDVLREVSLYRMLTPSEREGLASVIAFVQALLSPRVTDVPQAEE